jgi:hypothetical protein
MKIKNEFFGEIELKNKIPYYGDCDDIEGYYVIYKPKIGQMPKDHISIARVRLDQKKQEYVLDVCGQESIYSEELERYNDEKWWFSSKIL